ncbi:hypothetical protein Tco_0622312 [Tanacetum coccineum]
MTTRARQEEKVPYSRDLEIEDEACTHTLIAVRKAQVLHNIKKRDGESTEDFIQRYRSESGNVKGAPECMRISEFMHGITNSELIKRFHEKIPKTVDEMMQIATYFLQGQEAALNHERKKAPPAWKHQEGGHRQNFKKGGGFRS